MARFEKFPVKFPVLRESPDRRGDRLSGSGFQRVRDDGGGRIAGS
jgi:hypothetical protein